MTQKYDKFSAGVSHCFSPLDYTEFHKVEKENVLQGNSICVEMLKKQDSDGKTSELGEERLEVE